MLDWEGKVAAVLFLGGCNFACSFCHNPELVRHPGNLPSVKFSDILTYLEDKKGWLDGVVITGGEPTLAPDLKGMIREIRSLEYPVKLDTNGSRPEVLADLISEGLLDYIAMDIKTTFAKYASVTNSNIDPKIIESGINLIIRSSISHEFRTTAFPGAVNPVDIVDIAVYLHKQGAEKYVVQQFRNAKVLNDVAAETTPYQSEVLEKAVGECNTYLPTKLR
jgi:pyruvate formate lyase activating enzyme